MIHAPGAWLQNFWNKTRDFKKIGVRPEEPIRASRRIHVYFLWSFLIVFEVFYRIIFYVVNSLKRLCKPYRAAYPVISVGNISLGGTGKSVFVRFLMNTLPGRTAVLSRGYKSVRKDVQRSFMVSNGHQLFCDAKTGGDEACMLAQAFKGPVIIGKYRAESCKILEKNLAESHEIITQIILDDAYQHHSLYKNLEILLLDARYPFENRHCLPAGRLREKDISRAHLIVLTHADTISPDQRAIIKDAVSKKVRSDVLVLTGKHQIAGVFLGNQSQVQEDLLQEQRFFVCAGIGSWQGFLTSVAQAGIAIGAHQMFPDHYDYTISDIAVIVKSVASAGLQRVITTEKDWVKIKPLLSNAPFHDTVSWYVLRIEFAFLSSQEQALFIDRIERIRI